MSGEEFCYRCESDVHAIDEYCTRSVTDPTTGESRLAREQDDENQVVCGVLWSDEAITMSATYGKGLNPNGMHLHHLKKMLECVPNGRGLTLHTTSEFLAEEGDKFRIWVQSGQIGDAWSQIHSDWKNIFAHMEHQGKLLGIVLRNEGEFQQQQAALEKHCEEWIQKMETCAREGTLDDDPGEPPWA
jgi:hypothetical protein